MKQKVRLEHKTPGKGTNECTLGRNRHELGFWLPSGQRERAGFQLLLLGSPTNLLPLRVPSTASTTFRVSPKPRALLGSTARQDGRLRMKRNTRPGEEAQLCSDPPHRTPESHIPESQTSLLYFRIPSGWDRMAAAPWDRQSSLHLAAGPRRLSPSPW